MSHENSSAIRDILNNHPVHAHLPKPQESQIPRLVNTFRAAARWTATVVIALGALAFFAWVSRLPALSLLRSGFLALRPGAALAFTLAGLSLYFHAQERPSPRLKVPAIACAIGVLVIGLAYMAQYMFGRDLGFDRLLLPGGNPHTGLIRPETYSIQMAPTSAALFAAIGTALLILDLENRDGRRPAQILCLVSALFAIAGLGVSLFGITSTGPREAHPSFTGLTALTFVLLALGALVSRPDRGAMRVITSNAIGGEVARSLLPAAMLSPLLLCILCYLGYLVKFYDTGFGLALLTTLNSAVLTTLVWRTAAALNHTDILRREVEAERNELNVRLQRAMAETHHRVRNNLQIISALADIQVLSGAESVPVSEVKRIGAQVQALATVHDLLTQETKSDAGADTLLAGEVLTRLTDMLQQAMSGRKIALTADDVRITGRQASAIVVIANELITNAVKNSDSDVKVEFRANVGLARLIVSDNGRGFPDDFDPIQDAGTGLELIQQISEWDLQGSVEFENGRGGGGMVTVAIPLPLASTGA